MAILINALDGSETKVRPRTTEGFTLEDVYKLIGGGCDIVEAIPLPDGNTMLLDEEAKLRQGKLIINEKATKLLREVGGIPWDSVVGNALIVEPAEFQ